MGSNVPPPASPNQPPPATMKQLSDMNTATWIDIGRLAENMNDIDRAKLAYEMAIKNNHDSIPAKKALALLYKDKLKNIDKVGAISVFGYLLIRPLNIFKVVFNRIRIRAIFKPFLDIAI